MGIGFHKNDKNPQVFHYNEQNASRELSKIIINTLEEPFIILCIGTDRCIGDCLGPLVGYNLDKLSIPYPIFGTIENPIHAVNLSQKINMIKHQFPEYKVLAVDASLGNNKSVGTIQFKNGPIYPGKGVGKNLPPVGDYSLIGIVDTIDLFNNINIHQVRLNLIMDMAEIITEAIYLAIKKTVFC